VKTIQMKFTLLLSSWKFFRSEQVLSWPLFKWWKMLWRWYWFLVYMFNRFLRWTMRM